MSANGPENETPACTCHRDRGGVGLLDEPQVETKRKARKRRRDEDLDCCTPKRFVALAAQRSDALMEVADETPYSIRRLNKARRSALLASMEHAVCEVLQTLERLGAMPADRRLAITLDLREAIDHAVARTECLPAVAAIFCRYRSDGPHAKAGEFAFCRNFPSVEDANEAANRVNAEEKREFVAKVVAYV